MSERTLVMVALPYQIAPVQPPRPGTFVLGYKEGDRESTESYLNEKKTAGHNAVLENAWLIRANVEFVPKLPPGISPEDERAAELLKRSNVLEASPSHTIIPLTVADDPNGTTWSIPLDGTYWIYPEGVMRVELEKMIEVCKENLIQVKIKIREANTR